MPGKRKTSNVWEHFVLRPDGFAVCNHCKLEMSYCNNTGSLLKHLRTKHIFIGLDQMSGSGTSIMPAPKQPKLASYFQTPVTPAKSKKITELILNTIIGDLRPIGLVEGENFKKLIKELAPGYEMPSRRTLTRNIEEKFLNCKKEIRKVLNRVK
ncbi:E3 SUMO-protein ligase ZBED1-like [Styela clava]